LLWNRRLRWRYPGARSSPALIGSSELVNFNQTYPRSTTVARKNSGIVSGRDCCDDCRLLIIGWGLARGTDRSLLRVFPVIIGLDDISVLVYQSHDRVG